MELAWHIHAYMLSCVKTNTFCGTHSTQYRGVVTGGIWVYIPPKSVQVNFYGVKMTSEWLLNSFISPQNFYIPLNKFLAMPLTQFCPIAALVPGTAVVSRRRRRQASKSKPVAKLATQAANLSTGPPPISYRLLTTSLQQTEYWNIIPSLLYL